MHRQIYGNSSLRIIEKLCVVVWVLAVTKVSLLFIHSEKTHYSPFCDDSQVFNLEQPLSPPVALPIVVNNKLMLKFTAELSQEFRRASSLCTLKNYHNSKSASIPTQPLQQPAFRPSLNPMPQDRYSSQTRLSSFKHPQSIVDAGQRRYAQSVKCWQVGMMDKGHNGGILDGRNYKQNLYFIEKQGAKHVGEQGATGQAVRNKYQYMDKIGRTNLQLNPHSAAPQSRLSSLTQIHRKINSVLQGNCLKI